MRLKNKEERERYYTTYTNTITGAVTGHPKERYPFNPHCERRWHRDNYDDSDDSNDSEAITHTKPFEEPLLTLDSTGHYPGLDILDDPFLRYPVDEIKCNTFLPDGQPVFGWPIRSPNNGYVFYTRIHDKEPVLYQLAMETILSPDFRTPDPEPDNFFAHSRSAEQRMAFLKSPFF
ncbi:MAG: hypothetical protein MMC33_010850 [Icmadophila ericetorum]|nr:hypothetical protein [Icmadophila ericetorum]